LWKSLLEWEEFIYAAAAKHHRIETIETLDYLISDEDNESEEFYGMEKDMLILILQSLEKSKRCIVNLIISLFFIRIYLNLSKNLLIYFK